MSTSILTPFQRKLLQKSLETDLRPEYRRRIEIMLLADAGQSQSQICKTLNCSHDTARHWIMMAQTGNAHRWSDRPMGRPQQVNQAYCDRLRSLASESPRCYGYAFQHWTTQWLAKHLDKELGIKISDRHVGRLLREMGLSTRRQPLEAISQDIETAGIVIHDLPMSESTEPGFSIDSISLISSGNV